MRALFRILSLVLLTLGVAHGPAQAQSFPTKPVRLIVALSAGGGTDLIARLVGEKLHQRWGQPVIIENKPGALGTIAADYVLKQPDDGHTILVSILSTLTIAEQLFPKLPFDSYKDFAGVTSLGYTPFVWLVHPSQSAKTFKEFVDYAKNNVVPFGNAGPGSLQHVYGEMFNVKYGTKFQNVPYKGQGPALQDVVAGHIPSLLGDVGGTKAFVDDGKLRPLVVTGAHRLASMPDVPTFSELGFAGFERGGWFAMWVPKSVDKAIMAKIADGVRAAVNDPEITARIVELGWEVGGSTPEEFTKIWTETGAALKPVIEQAKIEIN
jgi:tripartite-type tricarboxylate transporter receptor subunit TctC